MDRARFFAIFKADVYPVRLNNEEKEVI